MDSDPMYIGEKMRQKNNLKKEPSYHLFFVFI